MGWIRKMVYRLGFRPKFGSIFFSPSLHVFRETRGISDAFFRALVHDAFIRSLNKKEQ